MAEGLQQAVTETQLTRNLRTATLRSNLTAQAQDGKHELICNKRAAGKASCLSGVLTYKFKRCQSSRQFHKTADSRYQKRRKCPKHYPDWSATRGIAASTELYPAHLPLGPGQRPYPLPLEVWVPGDVSQPPGSTQDRARSSGVSGEPGVHFLWSVGLRPVTPQVSGPGLGEPCAQLREFKCHWGPSITVQLTST